MTALKDCLPFTLAREGGYVNNPNDRGGATNKGITQKTYSKWKLKHGQETRSVKFIPDEDVHAIYEEEYFKPAHCDELSPRTAQVVFDSAVHHGPGQAVMFLQDAVGAEPDGIFGPQTRAAVAWTPEDETLIKFCNKREAFLYAICRRDPSQRVFYNGWMNRVDALRHAVDIPVPERRAPAWAYTS